MLPKPTAHLSIASMYHSSVAKSTTILFSHTNVTTKPKLVSGNTGSVTTRSSPLSINSFSGLSKFPLVAFSNATGFLMYNVLDDDVMLGALRRNSPSHNCCSIALSVVVEGKERWCVCVVQTGHVDFCSYTNVWEWIPSEPMYIMSATQTENGFKRVLCTN